MTITIRNGDKDIFLDMDDAQKYAPPNADNAGVIKENRLWTIDGFMKNADRVHIGDRIALPAFEVPAVKIGGSKVMAFKKQKIKDDAIIVDICDGKFVAVFGHCQFKSAMDLNSEKKFEQTQLGQYLQSEFLMAMQGAGIPAETCGILSTQEVFSGNHQLEFFKHGRNRIAFDYNEDLSRLYWLSTPYDTGSSVCRFHYASGDGYCGCCGAGAANVYVRPRFVIG